MKLAIRTRSLDNPASARAYVRRRLPFVFARFEALLRSVHVVITDVNGPRGGIDKECLVKVTRRGGRTIVIRRTGASVPDAVDVALARAGHAVERATDRTIRQPRRSFRRRGRSGSEEDRSG